MLLLLLDSQDEAVALLFPPNMQPYTDCTEDSCSPGQPAENTDYPPNMKPKT